jgi:hypothetical protein
MPNLGPEVRRSGWRLIRICMSLTAFTLAWLGASTSYLPPDSQREEPTAVSTVDAVVERIIDVESGGDPNAKNKRSSATGLGQFLDETWLDMIRAHRPDLAKGRSQDEILELRRDAKVAREITARFTERNAGMLRKRGLPVTPGTLYLAHFAGGAGAVAILSAMEDADAALIMPLPTQRVGPSEKNSLRRIPSSNASRSLILGTGQTAKCALLVYSCSAGKPGGGGCSPWSPGSVCNARIWSCFHAA